MPTSYGDIAVDRFGAALAHAGKIGKRVISALIATAFAQEAGKVQWRKVSDQFRSKMPKLAAFMDTAETDVLAYMGFPEDHWTKIHSTNSLERLNGEIKRRTEVVGIFPNDEAIVRLVGAILVEQNDEWAVQRCRYMTPETLAGLSDDPLVSLPSGRLTDPAQPRIAVITSPQLHHRMGHDPRARTMSCRRHDPSAGGGEAEGVRA